MSGRAVFECGHLRRVKPCRDGLYDLTACAVCIAHCPHESCGASPGETCRTPSGFPSRAHSERIAAAPGEAIPVELAGTTKLVARSAVRYVEAQGDYARLHTNDNRSHLVRIPLSVLEQRWRDAGFVRIHRSYLVALALVTELRTNGTGYIVRLGNGAATAELPVSRRHTRDLKAQLVRDKDAAKLAAANLAYRRPTLYDELTAGGDLAHTVARVVSGLAVTVRTVLDLGCGTGRDLAAFTGAYRWAGVGVDLQPALLAHGRTVRPGLDLRIGDLRTIRLGRTFDLITCLGNVLAYLHTDAELYAAAATFAAHAHPGTVLAIHTLTSPPSVHPAPKTAGVQTATTQARVTTCAEWDPARMIHTTRRTWEFADHRENDYLVKRVTPIGQLHELLTATGWVPAGRPPAHMVTAVFLGQTRGPVNGTRLSPPNRAVILTTRTIRCPPIGTC